MSMLELQSGQATELAQSAKLSCDLRLKVRAVITLSTEKSMLLRQRPPKGCMTLFKGLCISPSKSPPHPPRPDVSGFHPRSRIKS